MILKFMLFYLANKEIRFLHAHGNNKRAGISKHFFLVESFYTTMGVFSKYTRCGIQKKYTTTGVFSKYTRCGVQKKYTATGVFSKIEKF